MGNGFFLEMCIIVLSYITSVSKVRALRIISLIKLCRGMRVDKRRGKRQGFCKSKASRLYNVAI